MKQSLSGNHAALSNGFINSQLKKRIIMMTKKRSSQLTKIRYIWSLPLLVLLALVTFGDELDAQTSVKGKPVAAKIGIDTITIFDPVTFKETVEIVEFTIWENHDLDNIAILKGCQNLEKEIEQSNCSNQRLLKTLYTNIEYPEEAIMKKKEGEVIVRININNKKANYKILEDPGYGMGSAVLVALLRSDFEWIPAEHEGRSVPTLFNLPVKFVLGDNIQTERKDLNNAIKNVVMNFKNDKLEVRFSNPTARKFMMQLYDTKGNLKSYSANSKEILWAKSESKEVIVVLSDKAGHRVVRRVKQQ